MCPEEVHIVKDKFNDMYQEWYKINTHEIHPLTKFNQTLGLLYKRTYKNGLAYVFIVEDMKKFFISKIKHGI